MGLPADDLCLENAVVLERFSHRFPLVVDPAGQATRFLLNKYKVGWGLHKCALGYLMSVVTGPIPATRGCIESAPLFDLSVSPAPPSGLAGQKDLHHLVLGRVVHEDPGKRHPLRHSLARSGTAVPVPLPK